MGKSKIDYKNGQIYRLGSPHIEDYYIGSTTSLLSKRLYNHKNKNNTTSSKIIIAAGDAYIELIEDFPCKNKKELNRREGQYIRWNKEDIVNNNIAGRSLAERYIDERERLLEYQKKYNDTHKSEIAPKKAAYYLAHKTEVGAYNASYYQKTKLKKQAAALAAAQAAAREGVAV